MTVETIDPDASLDWAFDWATNYLQEGETIDTSTWSVEPEGELAVSGEIRTDGNTKTQGTLAGAVAGKLYRVINRIVTTTPRTDERSQLFRGQQT